MPRLSILSSKRIGPVADGLRPRRRQSWLVSMITRPRRGTGLFLTLCLFGATGWYGLAIGGEWPALVATYGRPADMAANLIGFRVQTVTISGQSELTDNDILAAAGVTGTSSLLFLDANAARQGLEALPLVQSATVRKLFPDTLAISVVERVPYALWQKDGVISIIAEDGTPIEKLRDGRSMNLPFVVGDGAGARAQEIEGFLAAVPDLKARVRAASLVAKRRWDLILDNGVTVKLPELEADKALARLAGLEADHKVLEKDVLTVDMRLPDRVAFRLSAEAAAARAAMLAKKSPKKGPEA